MLRAVCCVQGRKRRRRGGGQGGMGERWAGGRGMREYRGQGFGGRGEGSSEERGKQTQPWSGGRRGPGPGPWGSAAAGDGRGPSAPRAGRRRAGLALAAAPAGGQRRLLGRGRCACAPPTPPRLEAAGVAGVGLLMKLVSVFQLSDKYRKEDLMQSGAFSKYTS